jgi:hypothetical protein
MAGVSVATLKSANKPATSSDYAYITPNSGGLLLNNNGYLNADTLDYGSQNYAFSNKSTEAPQNKVDVQMGNGINIENLNVYTESDKLGYDVSNQLKTSLGAVAPNLTNLLYRS